MGWFCRAATARPDYLSLNRVSGVLLVRAPQTGPPAAAARPRPSPANPSWAPAMARLPQRCVCSSLVRGPDFRGTGMPAGAEATRMDECPVCSRGLSVCPLLPSFPCIRFRPAAHPGSCKLQPCHEDSCRGHAPGAATCLSAPWGQQGGDQSWPTARRRARADTGRRGGRLSGEDRMISSH